MRKITVNLPNDEKGLIIRAVRLIKGQNLEQWVRRILLDAATLEIAQNKDIKNEH